ncbi:hypothetical protein [Variovorax sp. E3]|uniref:hypothetical protein n=1 Tax=Variovorax sp. E3 TaxID=1914993 RepID=UPI0018DC89E7|nr:hypothetical protein [Variovorax sp. E3]
MWSILADLFVGIFDFVLDVFLFRGLRRKHGRRDRSVAEDAFEVARFDFVTMTFIALVCVGLMLLLTHGVGLSVGWSVGIGIAVGAVWGVWRYFRLVRE